MSDLRYFSYEHLDEPLRTVSAQCRKVALWVEQNLPEGEQREVGLQKLLEAKDAFVRAALPLAPSHGTASSQ